MDFIAKFPLPDKMKHDFKIITEKDDEKEDDDDSGDEKSKAKAKTKIEVHPTLTDL